MSVTANRRRSRRPFRRPATGTTGSTVPSRSPSTGADTRSRWAAPRPPAATSTSTRSPSPQGLAAARPARPARRLPPGPGRRERLGALTTPGLLYQDGWYLLDDSASALYDPHAEVTSGPATAEPYQDGYVFGYGQDYKQALKDLSTLTGPTKLLPHWAYGVWYSRVLRPHRRPTSRTRSCPSSRRGRAAGRAGHRHRLQGAGQVERLEIDPTEVPRPEGVLRLGRRRRACTPAQHPPEHPRLATRSSRRRRPPRRASSSRRGC